MARSLYICYFGVREPLVQTQVLPYLRELVKDGHEIELLTFEPSADEETRRRGDGEMRAELASQDIEWHWLTYHKRPSALATAWDVFRGAWFVWRRIGRFEILHGRVHVPTLMAALGRKFSRHKPKLLFDIRGFFPEEYTDAGIWPENGLMYRLAKRVERWLMKESDGFVVLTEKAEEILFSETESFSNSSDDDLVSKIAKVDELQPLANAGGSDKPVEVIPCCVDLSRFAVANDKSRAEMRKRLGVQDRKVIAYVGSFGGWYMTDETADLFGAAREADPKVFALVLTQSAPQMIEPLLRERGFADGDYIITRVSSIEIPEYLGAADLAVSLIKPCYSKQASSPTKNAEYLASGLPIIANSGVGDVDKLIIDNNVGALVSEFTAEAYREALHTIQEMGDISNRCREVAEREFDLTTVGGKNYRRIYKRILGND